MMRMALVSRLAIWMRSRTARWKRSSASLKKRKSSTWSTQNTSAARSTVHIRRAERGDDLEGAVLAGVGVERGDGLVRELGQRAAVQILAHALIDARIVALEVEERAHHVDVELLRGVLGARDDGVGELEDEPSELRIVEIRVAQRLEVLMRNLVGIRDQPAW